jgi:hypothetical protein
MPGFAENSLAELKLGTNSGGRYDIMFGIAVLANNFVH